jgi:hypothetical protein
LQPEDLQLAFLVHYSYCSFDIILAFLHYTAVTRYNYYPSSYHLCLMVLNAFLMFQVLKKTQPKINPREVANAIVSRLPANDLLDKVMYFP